MAKNVNIDPSISLAIKPPPAMTLPELVNFARGAQAFRQAEEIMPLQLEQQQQATRTGAINLGVAETQEEERRRVARFFANPENFQTNGRFDLEKVNAVLPTIAPMTGRAYMKEMTELVTAQAQGDSAKTKLTTDIRGIIASRIGVLGRVGITDKDVYLKELDLLAQQYPENAQVKTLIDSYKTQLKGVQNKDPTLPQIAIREAESLLSPEQQVAAFAPKPGTISTGAAIQPVITTPAVGGVRPTVQTTGQSIPMALPPQPFVIGAGPANAPVVFDPSRGILSAPGYSESAPPPAAAPPAAVSPPGVAPGAAPVPGAAPGAAPRGVTPADMTASPAGFPLSFPVRRAGDIRPMAPGEDDARILGQQTRATLLAAQREVPRGTRAVGEIIRIADSLARDVRFQTGSPADIERAIRQNLGGDARYKELAKDIAQVQMAVNQANNARTDQQTAQVAAGTGDATYPPDVLVKIARRLRGELVEIDARTRGAQAFQRRFGDANLADYQQAWTQNSDLRNFEAEAIMNDIRDRTAREQALDKILPNNQDELRELQRKRENIQRLTNTGTLR